MSFLKNIFCRNKNKSASAYAIDGEYYLSNGKPKKALKELNKAIAMEPDNDMLYASRSKIYKSLEKYPEALKDIETALKMQPDVALYRKIKRQVLVFID